MTTQSTPAGSRPRWELVRDLKRMSNQGSTSFFTWWWGLSKDERRVLMAAVD